MLPTSTRFFVIHSVSEGPPSGSSPEHLSTSRPVRNNAYQPSQPDHEGFRSKRSRKNPRASARVSGGQLSGTLAPSNSENFDRSPISARARSMLTGTISSRSVLINEFSFERRGRFDGRTLDLSTRTPPARRPRFDLHIGSVLRQNPAQPNLRLQVTEPSVVLVDGAPQQDEVCRAARSRSRLEPARMVAASVILKSGQAADWGVALWRGWGVRFNGGVKMKIIANLESDFRPCPAKTTSLF